MSTKYAELDAKRGEVVALFSGLEYLIVSIISLHYFGYPIRFDFILDVFYIPESSFAHKRAVLTRTVPSLNKRQLEALNRLNAIRNLLAHCDLNFTPLDKDQQVAGPPYWPDPRKPGESLDFEALYDEFMSVSPPVQQYLIGLVQSKGGEGIVVRTDETEPLSPQ